MQISKTEKKTIAKNISRFRNIIYLSNLHIGFLLWLLIFLCSLLSLIWLDHFLDLSQSLRLLSTSTLSLAAIYSLIRYVVLPYTKKMPLDKTAVLLEKKYDIRDNSLINAIQFEGRDKLHGKNRLKQCETPFAYRVIDQTAQLIYQLPIGLINRRKSIFTYTIITVLAAALWMVSFYMAPAITKNSLTRMLMPQADIPLAGNVAIAVEPSDEISVLEGDPLTISVNITPLTNSVTLRQAPKICIQNNADFIDADMIRVENNSSVSISSLSTSAEENIYYYKIDRVMNSFAFRIYAGNTYSVSIPVKVKNIPQIETISADITAPEYTGREKREFAINKSTFSALPGSTIAVTIKLSEPVANLKAKLADTELECSGKDGNWQCSLAFSQNSDLQISADLAGTDKTVSIARYTITAEADNNPSVSFITDSRNIISYPGDRLNLPIELSDDHGLKIMSVLISDVNSNETAKEIMKKSYNGPPGVRESKEHLLLSIDSGKFKPGYSYELTAQANDYCPEENSSMSKPVIISIRPAEEIKLSVDSKFASFFDILDELIDSQKEAMSVTENIQANIDDTFTESNIREKLTSYKTKLGKSQQAVADKITTGISNSASIPPDSKEELEILNAINIPRIISKIVVIATQQQIVKETSVSQLTNIYKLQEIVLEKLISMKGTLAEQESKKVTSEDSELPDGSYLNETLEDALENLQAELNNYVASQDQITRDRDMLQDMPADDLADDQTDKLGELAIEESRLAEILSRALNDFTNLDLQDFADSRLVENLKSIYQKANELELAARQAADSRLARIDAYRLETQAVELAEEILINCEATLGVIDSIQFIAEIPEDQQILAPLAELPDELVDLVGDLVTSEWEMAEELEDIGSYLNSLDHTAGPVGDGTISSTSAKGVTGDQKPEDNIIQGRSGAGRSGMADGQMVENYAKDLHDNEYGLRERNSNTPLESGRVEDDDKGAQTGGTGLAKMTDGATNFGMSGYLPPAVMQQMTAAAQTQQLIIQNARQLLPKLERYNLPTGQLEKSIDTMEEVRKALAGEKTGIDLKRAYNSTLDSLKKSHFSVSDQVYTRYIESVTGDKRRPTSNNESEVKYNGYEDMINAYFKALSK